MSVLTVVKLQAHLGRGEELLQAVEMPVKLTRDNPRCHSVEVLHDADNPDLVVFKERWTSAKDHTRHVESLVEAGYFMTVFPLIGAQIETDHFDIAAND